MKKDFADELDNDFDPPMTTINIGMLRTYSDHAKLMGCVRWPPKVEGDIYRSWMEELRLFCESLGAVFRVRDFKKPFSIDPSSSFSKLCLEAIQGVHPEAKLTTQPVTSEANVFNKFGIESLVFGPGIRAGNSQTPHESISIESLQKAINIYENIIEKVCYSTEA
ncbi:MAG: M20/M25/M40 family metallo-hydrolase [Bdellovibrionales bacterium]|nr:M20/M25/M40 family metallo-hydrolase [Bdellovibrionales bacterium]